MDYRGGKIGWAFLAMYRFLLFAMILHSFRSANQIVVLQMAQKVMFNAYPGAVFEAIMTRVRGESLLQLSGIHLYEQTTFKYF